MGKGNKVRKNTNGTSREKVEENERKKEQGTEEGKEMKIKLLWKQEKRKEEVR